MAARNARFEIGIYASLQFIGNLSFPAVFLLRKISSYSSYDLPSALFPRSRGEKRGPFRRCYRRLSGGQRNHVPIPVYSKVRIHQHADRITFTVRSFRIYNKKRYISISRLHCGCNIKSAHDRDPLPPRRNNSAVQSNTLHTLTVFSIVGFATSHV